MAFGKLDTSIKLINPFPASEATVENELKGVMYKALNGFGSRIGRFGWEVTTKTLLYGKNSCLKE